MKTEEQARECWCPFVRFGMESDGETSSNRDRFVLPETGKTSNETDRVRHNARCIASKCMAWRWDDKAALKHHITSGQSPLAEIEKIGYCGLAGEPK